MSLQQQPCGRYAIIDMFGLIQAYVPEDVKPFKYLQEFIATGR